MPNAKLFGPDGVADPGSFTKELPAAVQAQTVPDGPDAWRRTSYPPDGQKFYKDYETEYGTKPADVAPYAVYGYEAMLVVLDAIAKGGDDRQATSSTPSSPPRDGAACSARTRSTRTATRRSPIYGAYSVKDGELVFDRAIKAQPVRNRIALRTSPGAGLPAPGD